MRTFLALFLLCFSVAATAQSSQIQWRVSATQGNGPFIAQSANAACVAAGPFYVGTNPDYSFRAGEISGALPSQSAPCEYAGLAGTYVYFGATAVTFCTSGGTWNATTQACQGPNPCAERVGQTKTMNITSGWARSNTPNTNDIVVNGPVDANQCDGECRLTLAPVASQSFRSQVPAANGLHRMSGNFTATFSGLACSAVSAGANPQSPAPPCPGTLGNVNGRPVCFGTGSNPLPQSPRPPNTPPESYGNPAAGDLPSGGPQTPAAGDGGNAGGGSNSSTPGGGSDGNGQGNGTPGGTNPDGTGTGNNGTGSGGVGGGGGEGGMDPCGLPGTPPCKIDETGTPNGTGAYTDATNGLNGYRDSAVQGVNDSASPGGKASGWSFTFAFPTGCSPIPLAGFEPYLTGIDICSYQSMFHELVAMLWLAATVFCCIGMVGRAVGGGGS